MNRVSLDFISRPVNTKYFYNPQDTWIKTKTKLLEINKMNIKNCTENIRISMPDNRGASCT